MTQATEVPRLDPDGLRSLFLFENLEDDQLAWLAERGRVETRPQGELVYGEGDEATCFFVLLSGTVAMRRRVESTEVEINRTEQRGVYGGATLAFVRDATSARYLNSMLAITDATFWVIEAATFGEQVRIWFPMAMHLLEGVTLGWRSSQALVGQRERLLSLGRLSAGLTHELNNPASAAVRATASLRERVAKMRRKLGYLAEMRLEPGVLRSLTEMQESAVERMAKADKLSAVDAADAEDAVGDWLDDHGVRDGWDLAPMLVTAGIDVDCLEGLQSEVPDGVFADGIHWIAYALDTEQLMGEIEDSVTRISTLVGAARQYSQLDRAPHADIDVREGLVSTVTMLHHKIKASGRITLVKQFAEGLPLIPAYPGELNQVWTNLIDNAVAAMPDGGTLTIRTSLDGECVLVEVGDTGVGIPADLQERIFEPFFTTKPVGEGTGLGLDISYRVITQRHAGDIRVESRPGETWFRVRLPLHEPAAST